jgi:hypothetical protein
MLPGEPAGAPGTVHCYVFSTGDKYVEGVKCLGFFERGFDAKGKFLPGEKPEEVFVCEMIAGAAPKMAGISVPREATPDDPPVQVIKVIADK